MKNAANLIFFISILSILINLTECNLTVIAFNPSTNFKLKEGSRYTISINFTKSLYEERDQNIIVTAINPSVAKLINTTTLDVAFWNICKDQLDFSNWHNDIDKLCSVFEFEIEGVFVGWATFEIRTEPFLGGQEIVHNNLVGDYRVGVLRGEKFSLLSTIFAYTMSTLVCINTFVMGLQLDWKIIIAVMRRPVAPIIGFGCQFFLMPLVNLSTDSKVAIWQNHVKSAQLIYRNCHKKQCHSIDSLISDKI